MATWSQVEEAAPELASAIRGRIEAHLHHVLGTLTADGSPRLSGTEARFHDGQLWLGCMPASLKARDLTRDSRFALHSAPMDVEMTDGDAKLSGAVTEVTDLVAITDFMRAIDHGDAIPEGETIAPGLARAFVCDIHAATLTKVAGETLEVTTWSRSNGLTVRHVS